MTLLPALFAGVIAGIGILLLVMGLTKRDPDDYDNALIEDKGRQSLLSRISEVDRLQLRILLGVGAAVVVGFLAFWPVALLLAFMGGFVSPTLVGAKARRDAAIARSEAVASWAEQLRDVISSSSGLQEAIVATADVSPLEIRDEVLRLRHGLAYEDLAILLERFAEELEDPAADQIVVSLILAARRRAGNLAELLSEVAQAAREEASMRMRTEVSRAQTYSDAKAATLIILGMMAFLLIFNPDYLEPFSSTEGQLVLAGVGFLWSLAVNGLAALAKVRRPDRILAEKPEAVPR